MTILMYHNINITSLEFAHLRKDVTKNFRFMNSRTKVLIHTPLAGCDLNENDKFYKNLSL